MKKNLLFITILYCSTASAQLHIESGATIFIQSGAKVTVQGDVTSNADIQGPGTLLMKGSTLQNLNMNGKIIPNLEIENTNNVALINSATVIGTNLLFTSGKIKTGSQDLIISPAATISGAGASQFVWTDGSGQLKKMLTADITNFQLPVGENNNFRPAWLTTSGSSFSTADIGVRNVAGADPNSPPMIANYINTYWPVTKTGVTGGTVTLSGQYIDPSDVTGTEANLAGYYFNGTDLSSAGENHDFALNTVSAPVSSATGELLGINKFITAGSRVFLQGAYSTVTGLMTDLLRNATTLIPTSDPYRTAPYSTPFTHVANPTTETLNPTVFSNQPLADNNIVDWVFLQLRNTAASPGNTVLQTRSALLQRDGDIVDIDGVSPVTFNNVTDGTYALSVRHRNHLGLSTDPVASPRTLTETKSLAFTTNVIDLRTATDVQLFGTATAYGTASHPSLGTVNVLWGGEASGNTAVRYINPGNDKDAIISAIGGVATGSVVNQYRREDLNLNRAVRYINPGNDKDFLITVLGGVTTNSRIQALPN